MASPAWHVQYERQDDGYLLAIPDPVASERTGEDVPSQDVTIRVPGSPPDLCRL